MKATILIRCLNEVENLKILFPILESQNNKNFEVVFIDSGSSDGSFEFVQNFIGLSTGTSYTHKIIEGSFVTDSDGTGIVHLAPSYGADDYQICLDNGIINKESKLFQPL